MVTTCDTRKCREVLFHHLPPGQAARAQALLAGMPGLKVTPLDEHSLQLEYEVEDYTLEDLEAALSNQGFHLKGTLLVRIKRALAYYCERVQRENMDKPETRTKNYQAFVEAWEHRPHGDHDATPEEWRQYK
jgi:hypothetical protein